jgi:hypothetical protein
MSKSKIMSKIKSKNGIWICACSKENPVFC